ncbi:DnaB-like helicase N-terminal domain-containing protein [Streptomyces abikoensis]|uniref:DnaB-like helicase N-terminal domain-containing protein n=1 Tax=Streptomyces abikoensis TaxID=97398 RepID=UPI0033C4A0A3
MTHTETYDLDEIRPHQPVHYAEQALLGALLLKPELLARTQELLSEHFADPAHSALYKAMRMLTPPPPETHEKEPVWVTATLAMAVQEAPALTVSYAHTLVGACPDPMHVGAYARMIRADDVRRTLREHAQRLAQTANDRTLADPAAAVLEQGGLISRHLDEVATQWRAHTGSLPRTRVPIRPRQTGDEEALDEERFFLSTATARPHTLKALRSWIQPDDFTDLIHGQLYQCLTALAHRGDAIDPVTVLWEAQYRGLLTHGRDPATIISMVSHPAGSPEHWAERIHQRSFLARAQTTAFTILAFTNDSANTPHQLITGARRAMSDFIEYGTRRRRAHSPPTLSRGPCSNQVRAAATRLKSP